MRSMKKSPVRQRGLAAMEFALVSGMLFLVFYFVVSYGAVFVVQQSLSRAAAEGARALLTSEFAVAGSGARVSSVVAPEQLGRNAAARVVTWLSDFRQSRSQPAIAPVVSAAASCTAGMACRTVTVSYPNYSTYPLIPSLLPASAMPQSISASATVQLDPEQWARAGGT
jgi:Flp pilus assembly protein TadG